MDYFVFAIGFLVGFLAGFSVCVTLVIRALKRKRLFDTYMDTKGECNES